MRGRAAGRRAIAWIAWLALLSAPVLPARADDAPLAGQARQAAFAQQGGEAAARYLRRHLTLLAFDGYRRGQRLPEAMQLDRATALAQLAGMASAGPTATWIGHSTFLLSLAGRWIVTDPIFSSHASPLAPFGPRRFAPPGLRIADLPPISAVLLSHSHYDHTDFPSLARLASRDKRTVAFAPPGTAALLRRAGFERIVEAAPFQSFQFARLTIRAVPVRHRSGRGPPRRHGEPSFGWFVEEGPFSLFFAGDTGYSPVFAEARRRFGPADVALVPIGAYEPQRFEASQHVTPEDAVRIARDLGVRRAIAMHWGTFALTPEPVMEPPQRFLAVEAPGLRQEVLRIGETVRLR